MQQIAGHGLDVADMRFNEGISQPGDAGTQTLGAHPGLKGAGVEHFAGVDFTGDANQGGDGRASNTTIASLRGSTGFVIRPTVSLMAVA